jgi:hypothetical protein
VKKLEKRDKCAVQNCEEQEEEEEEPERKNSLKVCPLAASATGEEEEEEGEEERGMRPRLARLCERAMAIMQLVCSNFLPKFQCSPSHKDLMDNAASADQSTIITSTIIKTNLPGLDKRKEEGEERAWRARVCKGGFQWPKSKVVVRGG